MKVGTGNLSERSGDPDLSGEFVTQKTVTF